MADVSLKEQKLAAARKKLKKYQKRKDGSNKNSKNGGASPYLEGNHTADISSSRSSSVTDISESGVSNVGKAESETNSLNLQTSPSEVSNHQCENGLAEVNSTLSSPYQVPYSVSNENDTTITPKPLENLVNSNYTEHNIPNKENIINSSEYNSVLLNKYDSPENEGSLCSETNASMTTVVQVKNHSMSYPHDTSLRSTTESLRQLSLQMSGLVNDAEVHEPSKQDLTILELEKRNSELASYLELEKQKSVEQNCTIDELKRTIEGQNAQIQGLQKNPVSENGTEVNGLREQLQVHIQTIGILVAEKSELQTSIAHVRYALEQKTGEVTELQGRLDASREHVKTLEVSNRETKSELASATDSKENDSQQLLHLQANYSKLSKLCDEMRASTAELTERLKVRSEENQKLSDELSQVRRDYELAQVHVEQLRDDTTEDLREQVMALASELSASVNKCSAASGALEQAQKEKQQMEYQYQSYTTQLAAELADLKHQLMQENKRCEDLNMVKKKLESDLKSTELHSQVIESLEETKRERDQMAAALNHLREEKKQLEHKCSSLSGDNGQLSQLLAEHSAKLESLEAAADRSSTQQVDTSQLLQAMQSDKIAAARALTQNKQLKEQLEELQNGFIMMSNKKLELTEKLERELHQKKSLYAEISHLGAEVNSQKEGLLFKQRESDALKSGKPINIKLDQHSAASGGKEGECHGHGDNHHDHHHDNHSHDHGHQNHGHEHNHDHDHHNHGHDHHNHDHLNHGSAEGRREDAPVQSMEKDVSKSQATETATSSRDEGSVPVEGAVEAIVSVQTVPQQSIPKQEKKEHNLNQEVSLRVAHEALEKRFFKCMEDLAAVSDEKQNLEHVVQQLQLETETIGDYITIYIFQRGVLKQEMQDLKFELELMKTEKQEMATKLAQLLKLIESLASGKDGFMEGINSILNSATGLDKDKETSEEVTPDSPESPDGGGVAMETAVAPPPSTKESEKSSKTVKQIIDLISEMETSTQFDISALHKFHPCPHCSGKLITI